MICVPLTIYDVKIKKLLYSKCRLGHIFNRNCAVHQMQEIKIAKIANLFVFPKKLFSSIIFSYLLRFKGKIHITIYKYPYFK